MEDLNLLEYPIQSKVLLRKKKAIKCNLLEANKEWLNKKIAILCGSTADEIKDQMELFLLKEGIKPVFYLSEYNKYWEDAVFDNKELEAFQPDIIFIHTTSRNITSWPSVSMSKEGVDKLLTEEFEHLKIMWESIKSKYNCLIIQNNFERPTYRLLGNRDIYDIHGRSNYIYKLNGLIYSYAAEHNNFYVHDIDYLSAQYGLDLWNDDRYWNAYKYAMSLNAVPQFAYSLTRIIKSVYGKNKKVLALDLDNTLWGGVIGDDGIENIVLGHETTQGQAYSNFQSYIKELTEIGVLLVINSKNEYDNAIAGLNHPSSILHKNDFTAIKANWNNKDKNMLELAQELNLGLDSFIFLDDNPVEREIVKTQLPEVTVPEIINPEYYYRNIDRAGFFETVNITSDDLNRNKMYKENIERNKLQHNYVNYDDYLKSLDMTATIKKFEAVYIQRIAQLTNKTNQFNLTTKRFTEAEIREIANDEKYLKLYGKLEDKFGDNGVVSVIIGRQENIDLHLELWLMSCRVLKRGLEEAMLDELVDLCKEKSIKNIYGYYFPTAKNAMVKNLYSKFGFVKINENDKGDSVWKYKVADHIRKNNIIKIIR